MRAFEGAGSMRQQQKLRKKLDRKSFEQDDDDSGRQTRRKRFLNPDSSFGKRSLVFQLKHGDLKDKAASLDLQEPARPQRRRSTEDFDQQRCRDGRDVARYSSDSRHTKPSDNRDLPLRSDDAKPRDRRTGMMPMTVTYSTAASQFLYGRSVVKAALEKGRRQVYKLYVYGGENRRESRDNDLMINLAKSRNVPITIVPNEDQRLMDKMSMGRPHNGFVLETSPLPQLPVKSLGKLEESPSKLGFHIKLDYQTREEVAINGDISFIPKAQTSKAKPFVLLLHEILDPGNLGALLRTASYMGVDAVGITNRSSSNMTPVVLKSAAGAAEEVSIFTVDSPVQFLEDSKAAGWKAYAAVAPPEKKLAKMHGGKFISTETIEQEKPLDREPCILVLGNEGHGLPRSIKVAADFELSVPRFVQGSTVDSLNVSVAAGLLCHTFVKATRNDHSLGHDVEDISAKESLPTKLSVEEQGESLF